VSAKKTKVAIVGTVTRREREDNGKLTLEEALAELRARDIAEAG
jgi:hypothetical protein